MPLPVLVALIAAVVVVTATDQRLERALAGFLAVNFLLPDTLLVPGLPLRYPYTLMTVHRLAAVALVIAVVRRIATHNLPPSVLRPTRVHVVLGVMTGLVISLSAVSGTQERSASGIATPMIVIEQLVVLWVLVACIRATDDRGKIDRVVMAVVLVAAAIALSERFSHTSFAAWIVRDIPSQKNVVFQGLESRGDVTRIRGAFNFSLAFAWTMTMVLPWIVATASRYRRGLFVVPPAVIGLAIAWSVSRSSLVGVGVSLLVLAVGCGDRRIQTVVAGGVLVAFSAALVFGAIRSPFADTEETQGSTQSRIDRLAVIAEPAADSPFIGLGPASLARYGLIGLDLSYAVIYVQFGVIGLVTFLAVLATPLAIGITALRGPPTDNRRRAAAAVAGLIGGLIGGASFDQFSITAVATTFWLLAAVALVEAEERRVGVPLPPLPALRPLVAGRAAAVGAALVIGVIVPVFARSHNAVTLYFETVPMRYLAASDYDHAFEGKLLARTVCGAVEAADQTPGITLRCRITQNATGGFGVIRAESRTRAELTQRLPAILRGLRAALPYGLRVLTLTEIRRGEPTLARTAVVWLPLAVGWVALLVPPLPLREMVAAALSAPASLRARLA